MSNQEHVVLFLTSVLMGEHQKNTQQVLAHCYLGEGKKKKKERPKERQRKEHKNSYLYPISSYCDMVFHRWKRFP